MVTTSEHVAWAWSEWGRWLEEREHPQETKEGPQGGGGQEEEPRGGLPNLQLSPASWPQTFLQNALGDLNSLANLRHSWSLATPSPSTCEDFLLTAALLMLLLCLELTIAEHQPLPKPNSTVVTAAVCPHRPWSHPQLLLQLLDGGAQSWKYKPFFLPINCVHWIMKLKKTETRKKEFWTAPHEKETFVKVVALTLLAQKEFDANLTQWCHETEMPSWCPIPKQLDSKETWICNHEQGWASILFKKTQRSLRSFPFFIKECNIFCVLFCSL